jgi:glycosyltransferase involved in cell wall biosynthesis
MRRRATGEKRCFFIHLAPREMASFVRRDFEILSSKFRLKPYMYEGRGGGLLDVFMIFWGVLTTHFNVSWFGYRQAFWAVRFSRIVGRRSIVVLGGFDVCEEEDPSLRNRLSLVRYILLNADRLLAVSHRVRQAAQSIEPSSEVEVLYHGFDVEKLRPGPPKTCLVTTVGFVREFNLKRKGLEVFVRAAALLPVAEFVLVGKWLDSSIDRLRSIAPRNMEFVGEVSEPKLVEILQKSAVYVQASSHEGFGCSLAEAMLCGCVPVVSDRGAIPEVVGESGIYVDPDSPEAVASGIRTALGEPNLSGDARRRIASLFPVERRRQGLLSAVRELLE